MEYVFGDELNFRTTHFHPEKIRTLIYFALPMAYVITIAFSWKNWSYRFYFSYNMNFIHPQNQIPVGYEINTPFTMKRRRNMWYHWEDALLKSSHPFIFFQIFEQLILSSKFLYPWSLLQPCIRGLKKSPLCHSIKIPRP